MADDVPVNVSIDVLTVTHVRWVRSRTAHQEIEEMTGRSVYQNDCMCATEPSTAPNSVSAAF